MKEVTSGSVSSSVSESTIAGRSSGDTGLTGLSFISLIVSDVNDMYVLLTEVISGSNLFNSFRSSSESLT